MSLASRLTPLVALAPLAFLFGCATAMNPGPDKVTFTSEPTGASIRIDSAPVGQTPVTASVSRTAKYVTFSLPGYEETQLPIARKINPWVYGNQAIGYGANVYDSSQNNAQEANPEMFAHLHRSLSSATAPSP